MRMKAGNCNKHSIDDDDNNDNDVDHCNDDDDDGEISSFRGHEIGNQLWQAVKMDKNTRFVCMPNYIQ